MITPSYFSTVPLSTALDALTGCVPGTTIMPDRIFEVAELLERPVKFVRVFDPETYSEEELFDKMFSGVSIPKSALFIIPDFALPNALRFDGTDLKAAIMDADEFFFDSDAVFIWPKEGRVAVYHHEGGYFHVPPARSSRRA